MDEQEIDVRAIFGLLRRRSRLIISVMVVVLIATAGVVFSLKPEYTASSLVLVDPSRKDLLDPDQSTTNSSADSARVDSEVEIVKSTPTLLQVVDRLDLLEHPEFRPTIGLRQQLLAFFRISEPTLPTGEEALSGVVRALEGSVSVRRRGLTYLISIAAEARSPQTAAELANAVADAYIASQIESKTRAIQSSLNLLEPRVAEASQALAASESVFDTFIEDNLDRIVEETGRQDIAALRRQLEEQGEAGTRLGSVVESASAELAALDYDDLVQSLQSEAISTLEQQRRELSQRLEVAVGEGSAEATDLRNALAGLEADISAQAQAEIASLRQEVASIQEESNALRDEIRRNVLSSNLPSHILTNIYELQQNAALARTNYERLVARVNELRAQADLQVADSRVVAPAVAPSAPSFPNTRLILLMAAIASLGLGVGLAFLVENFVGGITSAEQLENLTRRGDVTTIPLQKNVRRPDGSQSTIAADAITLSPLSQFSEAFRRLRVRIDQSMANPGQPGDGRVQGKVVVVTSSIPVEGKSTTALALARTYSASGRNVLLIDGDLRKPAIHRQLDLQPSDGLFEFLSGELQSDLARIIVKDPLSNASVLLGARHSETPTEQLLASAPFQRLITAARSAYEIVVIDTAPIGVVVDGVYELQLADAVVFVTRWANTTQREVVRSLAAVEQSKKHPDVPVVIALTQQPVSGRAYQGKYSSYYAAT